MQRCNCTVRLNGDLTSTVILYGVSPPEVLILRHIHGDDAVVDIRPAGNDRGKQDLNERERLLVRYRASTFKEVFPGAAPALPETFKAIGIDLFADDDDEEPKAKRGKFRAERDRGAMAITAKDIDPE